MSGATLAAPAASAAVPAAPPASLAAPPPAGVRAQPGSGFGRALPALGLAAFGAARWGGLTHPGAGWRVAGGAAGGIALCAAAAVARRRLGPRAGVALLALAVLGTLALMLLAAGVRPRLLTPAHLDDLASGVRQGVADLPSVTIPYDGVDAWARVAIVLGGQSLLLLAAWALARAARAPHRRPLAAWALARAARARRGPRLEGPAAATRRARRARQLAALALLIVCGVPMTLLASGAPVAQGLVLFALLAALLWLDQVPSGRIGAALALALAAGAAGALAMPALDRPHPLLDYQALASHLAGVGAERFDWTQRYGPIDWPRDGSEVLRVHSAKPLYLKAEDLDGFDGLRWEQSTLHFAGNGNELPVDGLDPRFLANVSVSVRSLHSTDMIGAGTTLSVARLGKRTLPATSPGTFVVNGGLARGDSYTARVYYPRPTPAQLASDAGPLPPWTLDYLTLRLPVRTGNGWSPGGDALTFQPYGQPDRPLLASGTDYSAAGGEAALRRSPYLPIARLARGLKAASSSSFDYARRVRTHLAGFSYSESPAAARLPLVDFLTRTHVGYCQQFAGAMALLLRMGGVPARVATGFTPGGFDSGREEWVVRDYDAHAWVEAWFPHYGWVTFDPTPSLAPALRGTTSSILRRGAAAPGGLDTARRAGSAPAAAPVRRAGGGLSAPLLAGVALVLAALAALLWRRRRRGPPPAPAERQLAELERALRVTGRAGAPSLTLRALEHRFRATPAAVEYVRALRAARYGGTVRAPSTEQRRGLRRELARGRGLRGRARSVWALPPRLRPR